MQELLTLAIFLFWLALSLDRQRRWPKTCFLSAVEEGPRPAALGATVLAVVPARNEAEVIPRTLPRLLAQQPDLAGVVLVDDRSSDGTSALARSLAEELKASRRLWVVSPPPPPPGWSGKVHALAAGLEECRRIHPPAGPEWLLFTDADIEHAGSSVRALLAQAEKGPYDLVSVMARLHAGSFWERLLIPPFVFFFQLIYPFRAISRPGAKVSAAAGGCILARREKLEAAGGLATIRGAFIDDVALSKAVRAAGGRLWLGLDAGIASIRPYRSLRELWAMISRCAFHQLRCRWDLLAAVLLGLAVFFVSPPLLAGAALLRGGWPAAAFALGAWILQSLALYPYVRHHRVPALFCWTLPLAALLYALMTFTSAWNRWSRKGAAWKGRSY
ncbi:MAG: glycosyltransferase [Planctomycetes bacterium]|nr:glycosyltransferase [Planctomycetota bacterium]